jgi:hypothetical protein
MQHISPILMWVVQKHDRKEFNDITTKDVSMKVQECHYRWFWEFQQLQR